MAILKAIYAFFFDTLQTILIAASIFLVIYMFIARPFQVSGQSMNPTFKDQEYILTNLIGLRFDHPKRGDVIVFKSPTEENKDFIKRVIGVTGDTVSVKNGKVYLNGQLLDENQYLSPDVYTSYGAFMKESAEYTVPPGEYIVLGDNRENSSDSREWGFLKEKDIIGKSFVVYWPFPSFRIIKNPSGSL